MLILLFFFQRLVGFGLSLVFLGVFLRDVV